MPDPLADPSDVADAWRPLSDAETSRAAKLITKASAKLRQKCPFDIDARMALYAADPADPLGLDPDAVADVVATIVKRVLANPDGVASLSEGVGPFSRSATFVNRYDKSGSDVRGALQVTESDIEQLRPAVPAEKPFSFQVGIPDPQVLVQHGVGGQLAPAVVPDLYPGRGAE